jgi:hypothetical protein
MRTYFWNNCATVFLVGVVLGLTNSIACQQNPGKISIAVSGAQAGSDQNYYVVEIPEQGKTTVTITGSGQTPCPTDQEKCKCKKQSADPEPDGDPKYTFTKTAGSQDPADGPTVKWDVDSSVNPGEYKFKVTKIEQAYKACAQGLTGGVTSKSNTQESEEVTVLAYKIETETVAAKPSDKKRKKLGVLEDVIVKFLPSSISVNWNVDEGEGSVSPASGALVTYTAHDEATSPSALKATFKGVTKKTDFTVVEPSTITFTKTSNISQTSPLGVGFLVDCFIGPEDVNLSKASVGEGSTNAVGTGYFSYQNNEKHRPSIRMIPIGNTLTVGKGWDNGNDTITGDTKGPAYSPGKFTWSIPQIYTAGSKTKQFKILDHVKELTMNAGKATLSISKNGVSNQITEP